MRATDFCRVRFSRRVASGSCRGATLVEVMIAASIFTLIGIVVVYLTVLSAYASRQGINFMATESRVRYGLDFIRKEVLKADFASAQVTTTQSGGQYIHALRYFDPTWNNNTGATAEFRFVKQTELTDSPSTQTFEFVPSNPSAYYDGQLSFDDNVNDSTAARVLFDDYFNVEFVKPVNGNDLYFTVTDAAFEMGFPSATLSNQDVERIRFISLSEHVLMRNSPGWGS